jgi:hypothetical protein
MGISVMRHGPTDMSKDRIHPVELPSDLDHEKLAEATLGILSLTLDDHGNVWKTLDWDLMNLLFNNGWIDDPVHKHKSVQLTTKGRAIAEGFLVKHFATATKD